MEKKLNLDHIMLQAVYYVTIAAVLGFGTFTMLSRGYTSFQVGLLIAVANLLSMLMNFGISSILDRSGRINVFQMSLLLSVVLLAGYLINHLSEEPSILLSVAYVMDFALIAAMTPLFDQMSTTFIKNGFNINFGTARAFGSLSYAVSCLIFGNLTEKYSYKGVTTVSIGFQIVLILILYMTARHFGRTAVSSDEVSSKEKADYLSFVTSHPSYVLACFGYAGLMGSFALLMENFLLPIVTAVGGSTVDTGNIQALKGFVEIPVMFGFVWLERKMKLNDIFLVTVISFIIKNLIMTMTRSVAPIYYSQVLQCTTFALIVPAFISYVNKTVRKTEIARAFALQAMVSTAVQMLMNALGGHIIDSLGIRALCIMATAVSVICGILLMISVNRSETE